MGLCSDNERFAQAKREYQRLQKVKPYLLAFYEEHDWRTAGEQAIRAEMERRMDVYYLQKRRKRA